MATRDIPTQNRDPLVEPALEGLTRAGMPRLAAIDILRGLMIVLMVLDHVRDFFGLNTMHDPTDPDTSWPLLYLTRWITHLCAPTFVALAGASIYLQREAGKVGTDLTRFLLTRGAWLILLEVSIVSFGFNFGRPFFFLQVIWAIGAAMIGMSLVARFPSSIVLALGVAIVVLCPWAVTASKGAEGVGAIARTLLLAPGFLPKIPNLTMYPALPWFAIMCLGFGLGPVFKIAPMKRTRVVAALSVTLLAVFILLRALNGFGDPSPWMARNETGRTLMAFFDVSKYPPSPDYVLVTLGVSLALLLIMERLTGVVARVLLDFGRTPLFTYIAHIYIAHGAMLILAALIGQSETAMNFMAAQTSDAPSGAWGYSLAIVYLAWIGVLACLVPLSRWFAGVKRRRRDWWLSYL